jgi:hypothetical protein
MQPRWKRRAAAVSTQDQPGDQPERGCFAKTGSRDRTQAIRYAYTHGYADPRRSG